jgi:D-glycero-alpha-D-manno-heptose-7-phosphate kinase
MIISRTPLRISFGGGGTDLRPFYEVTPGVIIGTTINKYVYVAVNRPLDETIKISYWKTEIVDSTEQIEHSIVRKALELTGFHNNIDIVSIADIPAGTGLGSSGSFTVGLLNALYAFKDTFTFKERLAKEACAVEIGMLKAPIGKQDQYLAAYGGLQKIQFNGDESVYVEPLICSESTKRALNDSLLLFYTGQAREARSILAIQHKETLEAVKFKSLTKMKDIALEMCHILSSGKDLREFGCLLHEEWLQKKSLVDGISNAKIDQDYEKARKAGAIGGKIAGAGSGGFLLLYCEKDKQQKVKEALSHLKETSFTFESQGTSIITVS